MKTSGMEGAPPMASASSAASCRFPDLTIFRWLARCDHATAPAIGFARAMAPAEIRGRLAAVESLRLVDGRYDFPPKPNSALPG